MIRSAQSNYESRLIQHSQTNAKILYCYINSKQKKKSIRHHLVTKIWWHNHFIWCWSLWRVKLFFFKFTFTLEESSHTPTQISDTRSDINITEEICTILQTTLFKWKQGPLSPDVLHPHFLKSCAASLAKALFLLAKLSLNSGILPDLSKKALFFKKAADCNHPIIDQ